MNPTKSRRVTNQLCATLLSRSLLLLVALVGVSPRTGLAEDLTVRLINAKVGHPLGGQLIVVFLGNARLASTPEIRVTTSSDGTAVVRLPTPIPEQISVDVENGRLRGCSRFSFSTREVIERGVVAENKCDPKGKLKGKFTAEPGEVIVFARFLKWWEKMQR
jgi:hypothetical protein